MKNNMDVRIKMMEHGITQYDIAETLSITPSWVSRLLREPLNEENRERINNAILKIMKGG